jgi:WD40 repeat protein
MPPVTAAPTKGKARTELTPRFRLDAGDYVTSLDVSRDGHTCAVGTGAGELLVIDTARGEVRWRAKPHPDGVLEVGFSPTGDRLATCGQDSKAALFSMSGERLRDLPGDARWVEHLAWAPAGDRLATSAGKKVRLWTSAGEPIVETEPLPSTVTAIAWSRNGAELAASAYGGVHLWSVARGTRSRSLEWQGSLLSMAWSPDGKVIACGSQDCSVHFWRLKTGQDSEMSGYPFKPKALAWDSRSQYLATSGAGAVTVWSFGGKGPEGSTPLLLESHQGAVTCLAWSPIHTTLASGSQDTGVLLWEPRNGKKPVRHAFLEDEVTALVWHPDHKGLVGADGAGTVVYWEVA